MPDHILWSSSTGRKLTRLGCSRPRTVPTATAGLRRDRRQVRSPALRELRAGIRLVMRLVFQRLSGTQPLLDWAGFRSADAKGFQGPRRTGARRMLRPGPNQLLLQYSQGPLSIQIRAADPLRRASRRLRSRASGPPVRLCAAGHGYPDVRQPRSLQRLAQPRTVLRSAPKAAIGTSPRGRSVFG
jgi:hypothetical protein